MKKNLKAKDINKMITSEMIDAAYSVLKAKAFVATIMPVVRGYQTKILADKRYKVLDSKDIILDPQSAYLMNDEDFKEYMALVNEERKKAELYVEDEAYCPLLVAENLERSMRREFLTITEPLHTLDSATLRAMRVSKLETVAELTLKLIISRAEEIKLAGLSA